MSDSLRDVLESSRRKPVNIVAIGDSIACCIGPQDYGNVWVNSFREFLNARYKQHGSGIIPVGNNDQLKTNPQWSFHKGTGQISMVNYGPYQGGVPGGFGGVIRADGDAQLIVLVPERKPDQVVIYYASSTDSENGILIRSEKGTLGIVGKNASSSLTARTATLSLRNVESSTLTFSSPSAKGGIYLYGVEFIYDDDGVSVHNIAHGYARSEAWGGDADHQMAFLDKIPGGVQFAIISLGVNDSINGTGVTAYEYRNNVQNIIWYLRRLNPNILILLYDEFNDQYGETATILPQSLIRDQEKQLAQENHVSYLSPDPLWGPSSKALAAGYISSDYVHPTDLGDRNLAEILESFLSLDESRDNPFTR